MSSINKLRSDWQLSIEPLFAEIGHKMSALAQLMPPGRWAARPPTWQTCVWGWGQPQMCIILQIDKGKPYKMSLLIDINWIWCIIKSKIGYRLPYGSVEIPYTWIRCAKRIVMFRWHPVKIENVTRGRVYFN